MGTRRVTALCMAVICMFLTACTAGAPAQEQQEKQTLTLVLWDYDKTSYDRRLVEAFEQVHPDVEIQVISYPDNYYDQKMEAFLLGDKNVDVFLTRTTASLKRMCEHGVVQELDEMVEQYGLDLAESPQLEEMRYDGTLYGVPYRQDRYVLFYNCDLFDEAGVPYPQERLTWPQLYELAQKLQSGLRETGQYALMVLPMDIQWIASGAVWPMRYDADDAVDRLLPIMQVLSQMQREGLAPSYADCIAKDVAQQSFELGNYAMYVGGSWYVNYLTTDQKNDKFGFRWGVMECPYWPQSELERETTIPTGISMCKNSANKKLAWEFIQFASGKEGAMIMAEEQMCPAYRDEAVEQHYLDHFAGAYLDKEILKYGEKNRDGLENDVQAMQTALCDLFRKYMTEQIMIEQAKTYLQ